MRYLDLDDLRAVGAFALDAPMEVRDWGLLESALTRPRATVFGEDAYPGTFAKAAALLHSLVRNHALVDGNKRVGFTACVLLLHRNGVSVSFERTRRTTWSSRWRRAGSTSRTSPRRWNGGPCRIRDHDHEVGAADEGTSLVITGLKP